MDPGVFIRLKNRFICDENLSDQLVTDTIKSLVGDGAQVIVASESYGVDDMEMRPASARLQKIWVWKRQQPVRSPSFMD